MSRNRQKPAALFSKDSIARTQRENFADSMSNASLTRTMCAPYRVKGISMKRLLPGTLGVALAIGAISRGDEPQWKAAPPSNFPPVINVDREFKVEAGLRAPGPVDELEHTAAPTYGPEPPAQTQPTPLIPESLGQPRRLDSAPGSRPSGSSPSSSTLNPAAAGGSTTLNLLDEQQLWSEPPPVDPGQRVFFDAEYLLWFTRLMNSPPLLTTAPFPAGSPPGSTGFIGQPGTKVLYGNGPIGDPFHQGLRISAGVWLDCEQTCGIDGSYFFLGESGEHFHADTAGFPVLTRPFFLANPPTPGESGQLVSFPGGFTFVNGSPIPTVSGSFDVNTTTSLWGAEVNARECLVCRGGNNVSYRADVFAGFRYLDLADQVVMQENLILGANNTFPSGTTVQVNDSFRTHNQFYGGQVGIRGEARSGSFFLDSRLSLALGGTSELITINGNQFVTPPGGPTQTFTGGLLALSSNIGRHPDGSFSFVPEFTINVGMQVTPRLRVYGGYNFMLWTNVLRASEQIDRVIDVNLVPNLVPPGVFPPLVPERPRVPFFQNDFWAQGVQIGAEFRW
jgi:hypothetical protein